MISSYSYASFTKTSQGFISAYHYNSGSDMSSPSNILTDNWEVMSGTWDSTYLTYPPAVTTSVTGEIRFNHELYTLPNEFIFQSWFSGASIDATLDTVSIRFRQQDSLNYYAVRINWDSDTNANCTSGTCIEVGKVSAGTFTELGESVWTPATTEKYQIAISVSGSSTTIIKVYFIERTTGTGTDDIKDYWNQSSYVSLGSPIINVSDSTSPYTTGEFSIATSITSTQLSFGNPRFYKAGGITVNGLTTGQYALLCQAPEIRQPEASIYPSSYEGYLYSSTANGANKQGQRFQFLENIDLDNVTVFLRKVGSPTGSVVAKIYSDSAGLPNVVVTNGTSASVAVSSITGGTSPFDYPQEVIFTWSTRPVLTANTDYHIIIESNGDYSADASNYILITVNIANQIYGNHIKNVAAGWEAVTANDIVFYLQGKEILRASQVQSGGSANIDITAMWMPYDAKIKVATANTDCYTSLVDSTPRMETNVSGDTWTYNSGTKLSVGPFLGCPLDGDFNIWSRGSDYSGGTQTYKICYDTVSADVSISNCEGGCAGGVCSLATGSSMTSSTDYTSSASMVGLTANAIYYYRVLIDDTTQGTTVYTLTTPPSNSTEADIDIGAVSCLSINQMPYDHFSNLTSVGAKMFWEMGDNVYTDVPWDMFSSLTKQDYAMRHRDTMLEINNNSDRAVYHCRKHDDHEWKNDAYGATGYGQSYCSGCEANDKHFYPGALYGIEKYVSAFNPTAITSGLYNYKARWGKIAFISADEIFGKDDATDTDSAYYYGQNDTSLSITNPDAETGNTTGWTCQGLDASSCSTFLAQTTTVYGGTYSFQHYDPSGSIMQQAITVVSGSLYTLTAYARSTAASSFALRVRTGSYDAGVDRCATSSTSSTFVQLTCEFTAQETTLYVQLHTTGAVDMYLDNVVVTYPGNETTPSCTRDASITTRLNCTSTTFTTENPAISTTKGMVVFQDRMYQVSSVIDTDTVDTIENMPTGTDAATRIWKTGKQMLGRQQLYDLMKALKDYDEDSNVDVIFLMFSKPLRVASSNWPATNVHFDDWMSYADQRDLILSYIKNDITTKPIFVTGDRHKFAIYKHTNIDTNGQWEFLVGQGGAPNSVDIQTVQAGDIQEEFILRRGMGIISINTNTASDSNAKAATTFGIRDVVGNIIYDDNATVEEVATRKPTHTVLNYQHTYKIQRDTDGYCYALYYNGSAYKLAVSDLNCRNFTDNTLDLSAMYSDNKSQSPSMWWNDNGTTKKLIFFYVKSTKGAAYMRTATLTAGSPSWNADETLWFGNDSNYSTNLQIVTDSGNTVWGMATIWQSSTQDGVRLKRATCGTNCVTTVSGNALADNVTALFGSMTMVPINNNDVVIVWEESNDIYYAECDETTPSCSPIRTLLVSINTDGENPAYSASGGWQPQCAHDGSGNVGCVYKSAIEPYRVQFRRYNGSTNSWGSAIEISSATRKQTSPSISKVGSQYVVGWLDGAVKGLKLYKTGFNPSVAGDFIGVNVVTDDGWVKSRLSMSQTNNGQALLYWQRVFGVNKGGYGQPVLFSQVLTGASINPFILYEKLWEEVNP